MKMEKVCCRCKRSEQEGRWVHLEGEDTSMYSYGYCPHCYQKTLAEIKKASPRYRSRRAPEMAV